MQLTEWHAFGFGLMGSVGLEAALLKNAIGPRGGYPAMYKSFVFWAVRVILALISGGAAVAYFLYAPQSPALLYIHVGAATPAILTRASKSGSEGANSDDKPDER